MRLIVPLQGVVQGRGGLVLGSLIPCALFYFLQLYLKRHRPASPTPPRLPRTSSRSNISSPRVRISSRAAEAAESVNSAYYEGFRRCEEDKYHSVENPGGVVQLGVAENQLCVDLIGEWLAAADLRGMVVGGCVGMSPQLDGMMELKIAMTGFMSQVMRGSVSFDPSHIILTAGATPAIEILSYCLADPDNAFLVPSPYYPGFDRDVKLRTGIELIPVPCRSTDNFSLNIDALERAYTQAKKRGVKVRAVLVSNPSNPLGTLLNREKLGDLLDFVTEKNIHLISDEIYAGSVYGSDEFVSIAEVLGTENYDKSRVHIIYGLSKDLSISGFRMGAIYSYNDLVLAAASKLARFSSVSVPTERLLVSMLTDTEFIIKYTMINRERLNKMYVLFVDGLKQLGITCLSSCGGFYCWADMSKFLQSYNEQGELELWDKLLNIGKINVTPGSSCYCIEPGWFRCCFTTLTEADVPVVMQRIRRVTESN